MERQTSVKKGFMFCERSKEPGDLPPELIWRGSFDSLRKRPRGLVPEHSLVRTVLCLLYSCEQTLFQTCRPCNRLRYCRPSAATREFPRLPSQRAGRTALTMRVVSLA